MQFGTEEMEVRELTSDSLEDIDIALFSAGGSISQKYAPVAAEAGATVIDNSSAWRMHDEVPLVVPEVNPHALTPNNGIIANPNCSTIQMVVPLRPLHEAAGLKRLVVSTYQAVSGKGKNAVEEMISQTEQLSVGGLVTPQEFPHQIAFNALPHIDVFLEDGYTKEEQKMVNETRKIMEIPGLPVSATCVRVAVRTGHCVSLNAEFEASITPSQARRALSGFPGIVVMDDPAKDSYPTPVFAEGRDEVFVGRIRKDPSVENGLNLWIVSDNLRKGAALNTVQIAELLAENWHD